LLGEHAYRADLMLEALAINAVLLLVSAGVFAALLRSARINGSLVQTGE